MKRKYFVQKNAQRNADEKTTCCIQTFGDCMKNGKKTTKRKTQHSPLQTSNWKRSEANRSSHQSLFPRRRRCLFLFQGHLESPRNACPNQASAKVLEDLLAKTAKMVQTVLSAGKVQLVYWDQAGLKDLKDLKDQQDQQDLQDLQDLQDPLVLQERTERQVRRHLRGHGKTQTARRTVVSAKSCSTH